MTPSFEWDEAKAQVNEKKHGVSFEEAATVFASPLAAIFETRTIPLMRSVKSSWDTRIGIEC